MPQPDYEQPKEGEEIVDICPDVIEIKPLDITQDSVLNRPLILGGNLSAVKGTFTSLYANAAEALIIDYGGDILLKHGGDIKFTSVVKPTACTATLITTAGNVDVGTHTYKVTYVTVTGKTELGTASNTVTTDANNKQVALSAIPVSTSGAVTKRKIYRTKAGGSSYYLLTTIANNTGTTYTDNIADADLTGGIANYRGNDTFGKIIVNGEEVLSLGYFDIAIGVESLFSNTTGYDNMAIGFESLYYNTTGRWNVAIGNYSLFSNTIGERNVASGYNSLSDNTEGCYNTAMGYLSLAKSTIGNNSIALGYYAGRYETGSNKLFIDSLDRANEADGRIKSLIYGVFAAATANQRLTINAILKNSVQAGITAFATGGQASAVAITANIAEISVCATAQDSVKLPSAETGMKIIITNHGAASCDVFPNTDDAINEGAANAAKALAVDASMMCVAHDVTNWECLTMAR